MNELIFDAWTALTFKRQFGPRRVPGSPYTAPSWVGKENERRLLAYQVLQSYIDNAAREFLATTDNEKKNEHREYGDAAAFRDAAMSALLGDEQVITVEGAEDEAAAEDEDDVTEAQRLQERLESWADDERLMVKLQENERIATSIGDAVYVLGWSSRKGRPRLRIFDPGFYFPVLHDGNEDEFPDRVHVAWEFDPEDDRARPGERRVRRLTWELVDTEPYRVPWESEPVTKTCLFTDATWTLGKDVTHVDELSHAAAEFATNEDGEEVNRMDLAIDFLPVVHVSNTVAVLEHFGQSVIAKIAQILDDLSNADSDLAAASATTGTPPISVSGTSTTGSTLTYKPGTVFTVGDGKMDVLDTSRSLDALLKYVDSLLSRLSVNGRIPAAMLGRVDPGEVPSGVALALSFGPLNSLVREMRLAREEKYRLLLKFVHRLALLGGLGGDGEGDWPTDTSLRANVEFGSYLPNDEAAASQLVSRLLERNAISLEQAVSILRSAGITDRDQQDELTDITRRDFDGANRLLDATGDQALVLEYLGLDASRVQPRPTPTPGSGGGTQPPPVDDDDDGIEPPAVPPAGL